MKFVLGVIAALVLATPAMAQHSHRPNVQHIEHHYHYQRPPVHRSPPPRVIHRHHEWVAPAIVAGIGTAIIIDNMNRRNDRAPVIVEEVIVPSSRTVCTDWREVQEEDGRIYRERFCRN